MLDTSQDMPKERWTRRDILFQNNQQRSNQCHQLGAIAFDSFLDLTVINEIDSRRVDLYTTRTNKHHSVLLQHMRGAVGFGVECLLW
jgi:hypothetical protein